MGAIRMVCYQVECDTCDNRLRDYGNYIGMESPEEAFRYAVDNADWTPLINGAYQVVGILCPNCGEVPA